jgi:hypothetical protein
MLNPTGEYMPKKPVRCQTTATDICPACGSKKVRKGIDHARHERICRKCGCYWEWPGARKVQAAKLEAWERKRVCGLTPILSRRGTGEGGNDHEDGRPGQ